MGKKRKKGSNIDSIVSPYAIISHWDDLTLCVAERTLEKDPARYIISLEQMVENDYPIPSYMADIFQKPPGWVETPEAPMESLLSSSTSKKAKVYAIDCEMVGKL